MPYNLYMGEHRAADVDYDTPVGSAAAGLATIDLAGLGLAEDRYYYFVCRAESDAGVEEANTDAVHVRISDGDLVGPAPNPLLSASVRPTAGGKVTLDFIYSDAGQRAAPAAVQVARDSGSGYDWDSLVQSITIPGGCHRSVELDPVYGDGEMVRLACRVVSADGTPSGVTALPAVVADSSAPDAVDYIEVEQA